MTELQTHVSPLSDAPAELHWRAFLAARSDASVFLGPSWCEVVQKTYGHRPHLVLAHSAGRIRAATLLFELHRPLLGTILASSPYGSWGGVVADDEEAARAVLSAAKELATRLRAGSVELKNLTPLPELAVDSEYVTYVLPLAEPATLWSDALSRKTRRAVRKAEQAGLAATMGHEQLEPFWQLLRMTMRRLGTPIHSRRFYRTILESFGSNAQLVVVRHGELPVAGFLLLRHRDTVSYLTGCSSERHWGLHPNEYGLWECVRLAHKWGAAEFDFGRSLRDSGTAAFKLGFGPAEVPLHYSYLLQEGRSVPSINVNNPRFRLARGIWQRMPLWAADALGPALIRFIP